MLSQISLSALAVVSAGLSVPSSTRLLADRITTAVVDEIGPDTDVTVVELRCHPAVLVVIGGAAPRSILFCRSKNEEREIWDGFRYGPEAAREAFAMDEAFPIEALDEA